MGVTGFAAGTEGVVGFGAAWPLAAVEKPLDAKIAASKVIAVRIS
jgi:hypothetical protein